MARYFELCEFIQVLEVKDFDPKGAFLAHLNFVGYSNLMVIFTPQETEGNRGILETVISTNVQSKKLKQRKTKTKQRPKGESSSQVGS